MTGLMVFGIILYCIIAAFFHNGLTTEWKDDPMAPEPPDWVAQVVFFVMSALWPITLLCGLYFDWRDGH